MTEFNVPTAPTQFVPEFPGQRDYEEVVMMLFKHWYVAVAPMLKAIGIILISFFIPIWLNFASFIFTYAITTLVYYLWMVFWVIYIVAQYANWYRDRVILTTQRIINIDQRGAFSRRVAEVELDRIQGITHTITGFLPTLFNFGTIIIQPAGGEDMALDKVANPGLVQEDVTRLIKAATADKPVTASELIEFIKERRL